eukprot:CAMPEP_0172748742 /NCGR_PEP_ID=MMETSP1074-20121228/145732_1 /TAXON_ID=2916 /ORGANISM="Ceratium fusus, Strain PA161109" /LENGTH=34 /DNA_ID= /DNA_START= /DNA_END= /DNA_ORIENTATION=
MIHAAKRAYVPKKDGTPTGPLKARRLQEKMYYWQ